MATRHFFVDTTLSRLSGRDINKIGNTTLYLAENSKVPLLIWYSVPVWSDSVTGLCTAPDDSLGIINCVFGLSWLLERELQLYWPMRYNSEDEWDKIFNQLNKTYPELTMQLKKISETGSVFNPETDRIQKELLLVLKHGHFSDQQTLSEALKLIPKAVFIL